MIYDILPVNNYKGNNSSTNFDFDFYIESPSQLKVYLFDSNGGKTLLTYNVDYSLSGVKNNNGGSITFPIEGSSYSVLSSDSMISLELDLPASQEVQYNNSSLLNLESLEYSFDYLTRLVQILKRKLSLCVKVEECSGSSPQELIDTISNSTAVVQKKASEVENNSQIAQEAVLSVQNVLDNVSSLVKNDLSNVSEIGQVNLKNYISEDLNNKAGVDFLNINDYAKNVIANNAMPGAKFIDLTLGASLTDYVAPADGYFVFNKTSSGPTQYVLLKNLDNNMISNMFVPRTDTGCYSFMPVKKGSSVKIAYDAGGRIMEFRFVYAVDSESEV